MSDNLQDESSIEEEISIRMYTYDENNIAENEFTDFLSIAKSLDENKLHWIDIIGKTDSNLLQPLIDDFNFHPLTIDDILSFNQRLKIDYFPEYIFLVIKSINYRKDESYELEQFSFVIGKNYIFSFQELMPNQFIPIVERLNKTKGRIRRLGTDYLLYVLLDILVDNYFLILEDFSEQLDSIQENLVANPSPQLLYTIHETRREILKIRKATWPLREILNNLSKTDSEFVNDNTLIYFRDVYDNVIQIIDTIETYREILSGQIDVYISSMSNKMNEIMKVLTIISTIFIPLSFIAGIYGMNFQNMPELAWKWSYLVVLSVMLVLAIGMIVFFKRKKWF